MKMLYGILAGQSSLGKLGGREVKTSALVTGMRMGDDKKTGKILKFEYEAHNTSAQREVPYGRGPGSSGYFRRSMVVSDAFLTPVFPGRSELLW